MRNAERDDIEMTARRERFLEEGFHIFSERGIETSLMQDVAKASGCGIATLYRYFNVKQSFVIAVAAHKWEQYFEEVEAEYARRGGELMNAAEELEFYLSMYIRLYREHGDLLRFNQDFNSYVAHTGASRAELADYLRAIEPFARKFHVLYEKGRRDGTIRTNEPESTMFNATMHIMLAVCCRYAQGLVYGGEEKQDLTQELMLLKRMILNSYLK